MANVTDLQILVDGDRNVIVKIAGILDTANISKTALVDVSALAPACSLVALKKATFSVQSPLSVNLYWDANTDVPLLTMSGADHQCFGEEGQLGNNAGTGINGDVLYETTGYSSGSLTYSAILWFTKGTTL
jgi:hypothetical protein